MSTTCDELGVGCASGVTIGGQKTTVGGAVLRSGYNTIYGLAEGIRRNQKPNPSFPGLEHQRICYTHPQACYIRRLERRPGSSKCLMRDVSGVI
jgi:hypothetical protein